MICSLHLYRARHFDVLLGLICSHLADIEYNGKILSIKECQDPSLSFIYLFIFNCKSVNKSQIKKLLWKFGKITSLFQIIDKILAPLKSLGVFPLICWGTVFRRDFGRIRLETATFLISHSGRWERTFGILKTLKPYKKDTIRKPVI